ncbi:MAG: hypothetical protein FWF84_02205 [Kiritimatiellaeota bacterium]|nr:hypothetical protein [Kiritimatiellota bacterium]
MVIVATMVCITLSAEVSPYAGLWVGAASLTAVNEVSVPFDANNVEVAPDPLRPTAAGSRADIKLIVHVDAAGRASLLKDVAIVNRNLSGSASATVAEIARASSDEFSVALVTDPSLYAQYPMQRATRATSVVFDFGDAKATEVVDALVESVVRYVTAAVLAKADTAVDTAAKRNQIAEDIMNAQKIVPVTADDVAAAYQGFLDEAKAANIVPSIAGTPSVATTWMTKAQAVQAASAFGDTRAVDFVAAVQGKGVPEAWNAAAEAADTEGAVARLLASKVAGDALREAAGFAATNATAATVTELRGLKPSVEAFIVATLQSQWVPTDTRATGAAEAMFAAIAAAAEEGRTEGALPADLFEAAYHAGLFALREALSQYPGSRAAPGTDYTALVTSAAYSEARGKAAYAAAVAALEHRVMNPLTYTLTTEATAMAAAANAVQSVTMAAARARQNELPLSGAFGLGQGDPRFMLEVAPSETLGAAGLEGVILLPAHHATNPFRHRRHPDHTAGYDIRRTVRLDFDAPEAPGMIPSVTRGVSTVGGVYREEFAGLHKPLGPQKDVGLRTEGRFVLNRVSDIVTLNGQ